MNSDQELKLYAEHLEALRAIEVDRTAKITGFLAETFSSVLKPQEAEGPSRDWLAGCALNGNLVRETMPDWELIAIFGKNRTGIKREEIIAADAYQIADAMLAWSKRK